MSPCAVCGTVAENQCSQCRKISYCGIACQTKDWKAHKKQCGKPQPSVNGPGKPPTAAVFHFPDALYPPSFSQFGQVYNMDTGKSTPMSHSTSFFSSSFGYDVSIPERVYTELVDTFRLRRLNDTSAGKSVDPASTAFVEFLGKVKKAKMLPDWWQEAVHEPGILKFVEEDEWARVDRVVEPREIFVRHSENGTKKHTWVEMRLQMMAERIWGC